MKHMIGRIAVVGLGPIGVEEVEHLALHPNVEVYAYDKHPEARSRALLRFSEYPRVTLLDRSPQGSFDVIIEAVSEQTDEKSNALEEIVEGCSPFGPPSN